MPKERVPFAKVQAIREMLRGEAENLVKEYMDIIAKAKDSGDYQTAVKALQWLIEHLPAEDGQRVIDSGIDRQTQQQVTSDKPQIQIGIMVGGIGRDVKQLPKPGDVIDAE